MSLFGFPIVEMLSHNSGANAFRVAVVSACGRNNARSNRGPPCSSRAPAKGTRATGHCTALPFLFQSRADPLVTFACAFELPLLLLLLLPRSSSPHRCVLRNRPFRHSSWWGAGCPLCRDAHSKCPHMPHIAYQYHPMDLVHLLNKFYK